MQALELNMLRKEFGSLVAVNNATFEVQKGQIIGLIGPNGAGKTTLLRMIATVLNPTSGSVNILGYDLATEYLNIRKHLGYLPDFFNLYNDLTLTECLEFFARAYNIDKKNVSENIEQTLKFVELEDKRNELVKHLSRGMVQRMGVGVLLVHEPDIFLLDEPASGLDPKARIQLREILKKLAYQGKTVIISSHILTELSDFCSHIAIMNKGDIVLFGSIDDIQQRIYNARRIVLSVVNETEKAVSAIREFTGINPHLVNGNDITIDIKTDKAGLADLNTHLVSKGIRVYAFNEEKTDLEDLFMKLSENETLNASEHHK